MKNIMLVIEGMTCSACSNGLEKYLNKQNGIINANVNLVMASASIDYDENILNQEKIEKYIMNAGFKSGGIFKEVNIEKKNKNEKIQLIIFSENTCCLFHYFMKPLFFPLFKRLRFRYNTWYIRKGGFIYVSGIRPSRRLPRVPR